MGLGSQGVSKEDHRLHLALGYQSSNLLVTAVSPAANQGHRQSRSPLDKGACTPGSHQIHPVQAFVIPLYQTNYLFLLGIMRHQR
jgi:hypothetical protein